MSTTTTISGADNCTNNDTAPICCDTHTAEELTTQDLCGKCIALIHDAIYAFFEVAR